MSSRRLSPGEDPDSPLGQYYAEQAALEARLRALGCEGDNVFELAQYAASMLEAIQKIAKTPPN